MKIKSGKLIKTIFTFLLLSSFFVLAVISTINLVRINQMEEAQDRLEGLLFSNFDDRVLSKSKVEPETSNKVVAQSAQSEQERLNSYNQSLKNRSLKFSPNKSSAAYFQERPEQNGTDTVVVVIEQNGKTEDLFQGGHRLSSFEWLNDRELVIYRSCGTECMSATIIDIDTKLQQDMSLGVGYTWSPNKQYVAVYHYSYKYGISVANRGSQYGTNILEIRRNHPDSGSYLTDQTEIAWSPDSTKLAVVIRKENEEKIELLVYAPEDQFKLVHKQDLGQMHIDDLSWDGTDNIVVTGNGLSTTITVL